MKQLGIMQRNDGSLFVVPVNAEYALVLEVTEQDYITLTREIEFYKLQNGVPVFDHKYDLTYPFTTAAPKIAALREELASSDYKIIKCMEARLIGGLVMPYDVEQLHASRDAIREKIRLLEAQNG